MEKKHTRNNFSICFFYILLLIEIIKLFSEINDGFGRLICFK